MDATTTCALRSTSSQALATLRMRPFWAKYHLCTFPAAHSGTHPFNVGKAGEELRRKTASGQRHLGHPKLPRLHSYPSGDTPSRKGTRGRSRTRGGSPKVGNTRGVQLAYRDWDEGAMSKGLHQTQLQPAPQLSFPAKPGHCPHSDSPHAIFCVRHWRMHPRLLVSVQGSVGKSFPACMEPNLATYSGGEEQPNMGYLW